MGRDQTSSQIGEALSLSASTIQKYARDRRIPCSVTPGGHRRFNLEEVQAALYDQQPGLRADPLPLDGGLGAGAPITRSAAATAERDTRALVALADDEMVDDRTALQDLFDHARRVLVTSSR